METSTDQPNLRFFLMERIPEARQELMALPRESSIYTTLNKLYELTAIFAYQNKFKVVKRCLLAAEELFMNEDKRVSNAVCTVFIYRLTALLDKRDAQADVIHYLLPLGIRRECLRQLYACQL